jgi:hypothetical protein
MLIREEIIKELSKGKIGTITVGTYFDTSKESVAC